MPTFPTNATFTSRLQLPRPGLDDPADGPDGFNDLTDVLDPIAAVYSQGTLAARPAAGTAGRFYWATDARAVYYDDGTAWRSAAGSVAVGSALPILDVGMVGQIRAGRQLAVADFTALGLTQPIGLWNLSDLTSLGSDGRALTNKGTVTFAAGINGAATTAAQFAGLTTQALYIVDSGGADPYRIKSGAWGGWFRTAKRGTAQTVLAKLNNAATVRSYQLAITTANVLFANVSTDGTTWTATAGGVTDVCDDRWHFAVATFDGTRVQLYVDGVLEGAAAVPASGALASVSSQVNIGGYGADSGTASLEPHYGRIDEAFVLADALSEDQIRCLYAAKLTHTLGVTPTAVRLNVHRRRKGAPLDVSDFTTQPIRLYNFTAGALTDQGSGGVPVTATGANMTVVGGADGVPTGAYHLYTSATGHFQATDAGLPSLLTARSYGLWLKTVYKVAGTTVIAWGAGVGDARLVIDSSGAAQSYSGADNFSAAFVADGQWHQIVTVEDNAAGDLIKRKLYVDGRVVGGSTVLNSIALSGANRFRLGATADGAGGYFSGQLDGVFVCGYALTAAGVATLYAKSSQDLGASPKNPGDHVERLSATDVLWIGDTLESQHTVDLGVVA